MDNLAYENSNIIKNKLKYQQQFNNKPKKTEKELFEELNTLERRFNENKVSLEYYKNKKQEINEQIKDIRYNETHNINSNSFYKNSSYGHEQSYSHSNLIDSIIEDSSSSMEGKLAQLKSLKKEGKITEIEFKNAINRL